MHAALGLARLGYLAVGLAALAIGSDRWQAAEPFAALVVLGGGLSLAAAAWVRTQGVTRGAIASVGIVIGALLAAMPAVLAAAVTAALGDWPRATALIVPAVAAIGAASVMWRASHRRWAVQDPRAAE